MEKYMIIINKYKYLITLAFILVVITLIIFVTLSVDKSKVVVNNSIVKKTITTSKTIEKVYYVEIKGAVNNPGVYKMKENDRVIDVINISGGLKKEANTRNIKLSKKVFDEMVIMIYTSYELNKYFENQTQIVYKTDCISKECICPDNINDACVSNNIEAKIDESKEPSIENNSVTNSKLSINSATKEELLTLDGIGEAKADAIILYRSTNGLFKKIEDIKNVSGIGDTIYDKIKDHITI